MNTIKSLQALPLNIQRAFREAQMSLTCAYAPYSGFEVGAAVLLKDGSCVVGNNYESASYGLTLCAERASIAHLQSSENWQQLEAMCLLGRDQNHPDQPKNPVMPCGACRQWLYELSVRLDRDFSVFCGNAELSRIVETSARELLPSGFLK